MRLTLFTLCFCWLAQLAYAQRPNIVLIESDDQSNQALGAYGNPMMVTPNMDRLADEGMSFGKAYNMGCWSPAVCIPSRTMLFYGRYLWASQKINRQNAPQSLPEVLRQHGYTTYMTGKWHAMGKPPGALFDGHGSIQPGQLKTYRTDQGHVTDITGQEAADYISGYEGDKPFFLYVAFNAPHVPRQTEKQYYDLYPTDKISLPPNVVEGPLNPNIVHNYTKAPMRKMTMKRRVQQNNAMVTHMDGQVGRILAALENKGLYDNTIIVYTSDHGISFGENGVAGKVCLYEPSVTAPLIIKAPAIAPNSKYNQRVYLQDLYPTLLDLLDIPIPGHLDFKSLVPLATKKGKPRESIYLAMFDDQRGIIVNDQKLILYPKSKHMELYDLAADPWETHNLLDNNAVSKRNTKTTKRLLLELTAWQKEVGDTVDLALPYAQYFD